MKLLGRRLWSVSHIRTCPYITMCVTEIVSMISDIPSFGFSKGRK